MKGYSTPPRSLELRPHDQDTHFFFGGGAYTSAEETVCLFFPADQAVVMEKSGPETRPQKNLMFIMT